MNDSRHCLTALLTAAAEGWVEGHSPAAITNYTKFIEFLRDDGRIVGIVVEDVVTGEVFPVRAKTTVNCTGPYADTIRKAANPDLQSRIIPA
jgi:glycerol-3-phosphate dehydrogenase